MNTTSRKTHWEDHSHHGGEPWTLDSEHVVDVLARRISGRGGTRTPDVSLCLVYSQMLSPLSHSPKERGAEAPALVSMLSSSVLIPEGSVRSVFAPTNRRRHPHGWSRG